MDWILLVLFEMILGIVSGFIGAFLMAKIKDEDFSQELEKNGYVYGVIGTLIFSILIVVL